MPTVIQFNRRPILEGEEETPVGLPPSSSLQPRIAASGVGVDLTGKPKVWFAVGPGRSGKTMLLRWAVEMSATFAPECACPAGGVRTTGFHPDPAPPGSGPNTTP